MVSILCLLSVCDDVLLYVDFHVPISLPFPVNGVNRITPGDVYGL